jgi:hypothetical protein
MIFRRARMKSTNVIRNYYVLPCCLLLLNLCVEIVSYKAKMLDDPLLRTGAIMGMVLFGGSLVGFVVAPLIGRAVVSLQRGSRQGGGEMGEIVFLLLLGVVVFWLYYRVYIIGPESVLPADWHNPVVTRITR